jgi:hypothetical protein
MDRDVERLRSPAPDGGESTGPPSRKRESAVRRADGEPAQRQGDILESQILPEYLEKRGRKPPSTGEMQRRRST